MDDENYSLNDYIVKKKIHISRKSPGVKKDSFFNHGSGSHRDYRNQGFIAKRSHNVFKRVSKP